jgi:hypothetical protein
MPEIKLTNVDTVVSQNNKALSIDAAVDLTDSLKTNIVNVADNQVLAYQSSSGKWVNSTSAGGGGGTTLSDVGISFDVQGADNVWEVDATPSTTAFSVAKSEEPDGSINFDFPVNTNP